VQLRILLVGPHPFLGGGVAAYEQALAKTLAIKGHKIGIVGIDYRPLVRSSQLKVLRNQELGALGIETFILSHGNIPYFGCSAPVEQCESPNAEALFETLLRSWGPQVVHFHAARPASIVKVTKRNGIPCLISVHDYWFLCSLGFLVRRDGALCDGPEDGAACVKYCYSPDRGIASWLLSRHAKRISKRILPEFLYERLREAHRTLRLLTSREFGSRSTLVSSSKAKTLKFKPAELQMWRFRTNYMRNLLVHEPDAIIAVSAFVKEKLLEFGVLENKIRLMHSGFEYASGYFQNVSHRSLIRKPIVFGYVSPIFQEKGLHVLVEAFREIPAGAARLLIYGRLNEWAEWYWRPLLDTCRMLHNVEVRGEFRYSELPNIFSQMDVLVVPPIMHDPSPRVIWEALSAGVPVVASAAGGIPDFVNDGVNGLLFERGNPEDLRRKLDMLIDNPVLIRRLRDGIKPLKDMTEHSEEMLEVYQQIVRDKEDD